MSDTKLEAMLRDYLVLCGRAAVRALGLDEISTTPSDIQCEIARLKSIVDKHEDTTSPHEVAEEIDRLGAEIQRLETIEEVVKQLAMSIAPPDYPNLAIADTLEYLHVISESITGIRAANEDLHAIIDKLQREKAARVYYQDQVYHACLVIDRLLGGGTTTGTLETPESDFKQRCEAMEAKTKRLQAVVDKLPKDGGGVPISHGDTTFCERHILHEWHLRLRGGERFEKHTETESHTVIAR